MTPPTKIYQEKYCKVERPQAQTSFFKKKRLLIFTYSRFKVKMTKNNQKFNMLKTNKNFKSQINQKFNILKTTKNCKLKIYQKSNILKIT